MNFLKKIMKFKINRETKLQRNINIEGQKTHRISVPKEKAS